jgi:hypothetical protein
MTKRQELATPQGDIVRLTKATIIPRNLASAAQNLSRRFSK